MAEDEFQQDARTEQLLRHQHSVQKRTAAQKGWLSFGGLPGLGWLSSSWSDKMDGEGSVLTAEEEERLYRILGWNDSDERQLEKEVIS